MITLDGIELPHDLRFVESKSWQKIKQDIKTSLTGAPIIQESVLTKGQPITLDSGEGGWIDLSVVRQLISKANQHNPNSMVLNYHGTRYNVRFRYENGNAVEAKPLFYIVANEEEPTDKHTITIKLIEV